VLQQDAPHDPQVDPADDFRVQAGGLQQGAARQPDLRGGVGILARIESEVVEDLHDPGPGGNRGQGRRRPASARKLVAPLLAGEEGVGPRM
jgi:hypothetical protein